MIMGSTAIFILGMIFGGTIVLVLFAAIVAYSEHRYGPVTIDDETLYSDKEVKEAKKNELP